MKNFLKTLWTEISNCNRYKVIAAIFCTAFLIWMHGCSIKGNSIMHPGQKVTIEDLQLEVDEFISRAQKEANNMAKQDEFRSFLWNTGLTVANTGVFNWLQFLTGAGTILGAGAIADNIRYRLKFPKSPPTT